LFNITTTIEGTKLEQNFGFCDNYDKFVLGMKHEIRKSSSDVFSRTIMAETGKIVIGHFKNYL